MQPQVSNQPTEVSNEPSQGESAVTRISCFVLFFSFFYSLLNVDLQYLQYQKLSNSNINPNLYTNTNRRKFEASRCNQNQSKLQLAVYSRSSCYGTALENNIFYRTSRYISFSIFKYLKVIPTWVSRNWSQSMLVSAATCVSRSKFQPQLKSVVARFSRSSSQSKLV